MEPQLYKAATQGNVHVLKQLIDKEPKLMKSVTPKENTLLHIAARHGHRDFADELLRRSDAFLILKNADEDTALHIASRNGHSEMVALLVDRAAWPTDIEGNEEGPLKLTNKLQNTALHDAVTNGHLRIAVKLLKAEPTASHMLNAKKETPLHIAAREGLHQVVFEILEQPWVESREEEELPPVETGSPLHQAVLGGNGYILDLLLEKRKDFINVNDKEGNNALHYAAWKNNRKMVEKLLKSEPSLAYHKNEKGYSSLHDAAAHGSTSSIKELLKHCPDAAEQVDSEGRNALHIAATTGSVDALKCLLKIIQLEEIINQADDKGNTPLHLAAQNSRIKSTMALLDDKRVNPFIVNKDGLTPRRVIESSGKRDTYYKILILHLLKKRENQIDKKRTPWWHLGRYFQKKMSSVATDEQFKFKSSAQTYTLVAALIATVTFAATFTMPGGYDNNTGYALLQSQAAFKAFVISNTIAMCSSLIVVFCFIWAWKDPVRFQVDQMTWGHRLIILASIAMLVALMTAVYVVVAKQCMWLAIVVCLICCSAPFLLWAILGLEILFIPM